LEGIGGVGRDVSGVDVARRERVGGGKGKVAKGVYMGETVGKERG